MSAVSKLQQQDQVAVRRRRSCSSASPMLPPEGAEALAAAGGTERPINLAVDHLPQLRRGRASSFSFPEEYTANDEGSGTSEGGSTSRANSYALSVDASVADSFPVEVANEVLKIFVTDLELAQLVLEEASDNLVRVYVALFSRVGGLQPLLDRVLLSEFVGHTEDKDAILRGNSRATKLMSHYSNVCAASWLRSCLLRPVRKAMVYDKALKLQGEAGDRTALMGLATHLLQGLEEGCEAAPRSLRCMCYLIRRHARERSPGNEHKLLGGFVMLRLVNPVLVDPDAVDLLQSSEKLLAPGLRKNLLTLSKLVQYLSNEKRYPADSPMVSCNVWLESNYGPLCVILDRLCEDVDPTQPSPFADMLKTPEAEQLGDLVAIIGSDGFEQLHTACLECKTNVMLRATMSRFGGSPRSTPKTVEEVSSAAGFGERLRRRGSSSAKTRALDLFGVASSPPLSSSPPVSGASPRSGIKLESVERFYEVLSHVDEPQAARESGYRVGLLSCRRDSLVEVGILLEEDAGRARSFSRLGKTASKESARLTRVAYAMADEEFGVVDEAPLTLERVHQWAHKYLGLRTTSETETLLLFLHKKRLVVSKGGSKAALKTYQLDIKKINTMARLLG